MLNEHALIGDRCPPVPNVKNAHPSTLLAVNGTTVTYTCYDGYIFPHNTTNTSVSCNGELWSMEPSACLSEYLLKELHKASR